MEYMYTISQCTGAWWLTMPLLVDVILQTHNRWSYMMHDDDCDLHVCFWNLSQMLIFCCMQSSFEIFKSWGDCHLHERKSGHATSNPPLNCQLSTICNKQIRAWLAVPGPWHNEKNWYIPVSRMPGTPPTINLNFNSPNKYQIHFNFKVVTN